MKAVILAGGLGSRLSEETELKPKPLVEIGGKPILWHIMKIYSSYGINDFIICCGYKGHLIKEYFANYTLHQSDVVVNMKNNIVKFYRNNLEPWNITLVDTGKNTMTGGRLKRVSKYIKKEKFFFFTYGDCVSDINISSLIKFHKQHGRKSTVLAIRPPGRFGVIKIGNNNKVEKFQEKIDENNNWINGGFFILNPDVISRIKDDQSIWELEPMISLVKDDQLRAFKHEGFWQPMDTLREKNYLNEIWNLDKAPWKKW
jgi:glucose-1-phosphate cytidylyltransferase